jgi:hypothetical protein
VSEFAPESSYPARLVRRVRQEVRLAAESLRAPACLPVVCPPACLSVVRPPACLLCARPPVCCAPTSHYPGACVPVSLWRTCFSAALPHTRAPEAPPQAPPWSARLRRRLRPAAHLRPPQAPPPTALGAHRRLRRTPDRLRRYDRLGLRASGFGNVAGRATGAPLSGFDRQGTLCRGLGAARAEGEGEGRRNLLQPLA